MYTNVDNELGLTVVKTDEIDRNLVNLCGIFPRMTKPPLSLPRKKHRYVHPTLIDP
jgi:hypothetical protein